MRDARIELYRICLMIGIVFLHVGYMTTGSFSWQNNIFRWCVDGFVLISGYFGVRFSLKKVVRLYAVYIFVSIMAQTVLIPYGGGGVIQ